MKRLFHLSSSWFPVWLISLLMLCMSSIYLPVFSGAKQNLTNVPLIIVNEDEGTVGDAILLNLIKNENGNSFKWKLLEHKALALHDLKNNKAYGALMIPPDYSKRLSLVHDALIAGKENEKPATLDILLNEGIGQSASLIASNTLQSVATYSSQEISNNLKKELQQKRRTVSPTNASLLDNPVQIVTKNVLGLPVNLNKGMTPFVMTLISSITGLMGANMIHGYVMRGSGALQKEGMPLSRSEVLAAQLIFGAVLSFCVSIVLQLVVFGFFGSAHASSIWAIFLYSFYCCITMFFLFKTIALFFGGWGMLVMFPVNIMGIFSSGGAIPLSTLPVVHRIFSSILPTRYVVDGMRALLYYKGRLQAGLGEALTAISIYFIVTLVIFCAYMYYTDKKDRDAEAAEKEEKIEIQMANDIHEESEYETTHRHKLSNNDEIVRQELSKWLSSPQSPHPKRH